MDTSWIEIFVLTFVECVAPAGKSVCQEQQFELKFHNQTDCQYAMQQLIKAKDELDYVIVDRSKTRCAPTAAVVGAYSSLDAINAANENTSGWLATQKGKKRRGALNKNHSERLDQMKTCEKTQGIAPCKIGEVIVEEATGDSVDVWKRNK